MDRDIPPGAHLVTPRKWYSHHGIFVGNGRVVHYAGFSRMFRPGPVEETSLESFAKHFGFRVQPHAMPAFSREEIVRRAKARLGEDRYCVLSNNCEHFTQWCLYGRARSGQVERLVEHPTRAVRFIVSRLASFAASLFGEGTFARRANA